MTMTDEQIRFFDWIKEPERLEEVWMDVQGGTISCTKHGGSYLSSSAWDTYGREGKPITDDMGFITPLDVWKVWTKADQERTGYGCEGCK